MTIRKILQLGNPALYEKSDPVLANEMKSLAEVINDLHDTLLDIRERCGIGRAIAAPQIGIKKRIIYMNIDGPVVFINPEIVEKSAEMIELVDECTSFPDLLIRVKRHQSCSIIYHDPMWNHHSMCLEGDLSELLQHECDHLDGFLAIDRAINLRSFSYKSEVNSNS